MGQPVKCPYVMGRPETPKVNTFVFVTEKPKANGPLSTTETMKGIPKEGADRSWIVDVGSSSKGINSIKKKKTKQTN